MAIAPGRTSIEIDSSGRLAFLQAAPRGDMKPRPLDWNALLTAAGLDPRTLQAIPPRFVPPAPTETLRSWSGTYPGDRTPVRVEAGAWRGVPTFFRITGPWDEVADPFKDLQFSERAVMPFLTVMGVIVFGAGILLAWRNFRLRRGDRQGTLRLAAFVFLCELTGGLLWSMSFDRPGEILSVFAYRAGEALFAASVLCLFYIALEPFIRRRWPALLIGWARLASGRLRDPMVGRDVLIGMIGGLGYALVAAGTDLVLKQMSVADGGFDIGETMDLLGLRYTIGHLLGATTTGIACGLIMVIVLVVLMMAFRRRALAAAGLFVLVLTAFLFAIAGRWQMAPFVALVAALITFITVRYGLLASTVTQTTFFMLFFAPHVSTSWAAPMMACVYSAWALLAVWAFRTSLGGQSILGEGVLGD